MFIWLASYPRSGNGFARRVMAAAFGVGSIEIYRRAGVNQEAVDSDPEPILVKSHDLPGDDCFPAIYLVRDGRDALVSYTWWEIQYILNRNSDEISVKEFSSILRNHIVQKESRFGGWGENVSNWINRKNTVVVRFEDLIRSPVDSLYDAASLLDLKLDKKLNPEILSFEELRQLRPAIYRRGVIGSWKDEFPADLLELFWECNGESMSLLGYSQDQN